MNIVYRDHQMSGKTIEQPQRTRTTLGITPGSALVPCIVWVLPEDVTPYAKMVTV